MKILIFLWTGIKNNWEGITALASLAASIAAFLALYYTNWKSFDLKIYSAGRYSLSINHRNPSQLAISPILIFKNEGARSGIIENISLIIKNANGNQFLLRPISFLLERTTGKSKIDEESFIKFQINDKETLIKQIMFVFPLIEPFMLGEGEYEVDIYAKTSNEKEMKKYTSMKISVDPYDLELIRKNTPNTSYLKPGETVFATTFWQDKTNSDMEQEYKNLFQKINKNISIK